MARYHGWNEVEVRSSDNGMDRNRQFIRAHVATSPTQTMNSFVPINNGFSIPSATSLSKAQSRGIDGDKLFDLPDDTFAADPAHNGQKRKRTTSGPCPSPKSSRRSASQRSMGSGPLQSSTLHASEKSSNGTSKLELSELSSNANIIKSIARAPDQTTTKASFSTPKVPVVKSAIEKSYSFIFQAQDVRTDSSINDSTPPVVDDEGKDYNGFTIKNVQHDVSLARNIAANSDTSYYQAVRDVSKDIGILYHRNGCLPHGGRGLTTSVPNEGSDQLFDSDDEFPVDFEDEVEMAQLPLHNDMINKITPGVLVQPIAICNQPQSEDFDVCYEPSRSNWHESGIDSNTTLTILENSLSLDASSAMIDMKDRHYIDHGASQGSTSAIRTSCVEISARKAAEYLPIPIFARPNFPSRVRDRSPIDGLSANLISPVCFRLGELIRIGGYWSSVGQDARVELFARVRSSSREALSSKQLFQFADLFHDHRPFLHGILENCKAYGLQETESRQLLGPEGMGQMVRCIGTLKRTVIGAPEWIFDIKSIRATDWEEVRYLKAIAGAGLASLDR